MNHSMFVVLFAGELSSKDPLKSSADFNPSGEKEVGASNAVVSVGFLNTNMPSFCTVCVMPVSVGFPNTNMPSF